MKTKIKIQNKTTNRTRIGNWYKELAYASAPNQTAVNKFNRNTNKGANHG